MKTLNYRQNSLICSTTLLLLLMATAYAQINENTVEELVKQSPCFDGKTIDGVLKDKIKLSSQRDLGWQVFNESGEFEVERAFLMNKSMQLRFRWRVNANGSIKPVSSRAEVLCNKE